MLAARKRKKSMTANYLISSDPNHMTKESLAFMGKVQIGAKLATCLCV